MFDRARHQLCGIVVIAGAPLMFAGQSTADVITYLSSQRFVTASGDGPFRTDAVGFNDFSATLTNFDDDGTGLGFRRTRATQTSRLLPDRIEAFTWAETDWFTGGTAPNVIEAASVVDVQFRILVATPFAAYFGPAFQQTEGDTYVLLSRVGQTTGPYPLSLSVPLGVVLNPAPIFGTLPPDSYRIQIVSVASSRQLRIGQGSVSVSFVLPAPATSSLLFFMLAGSQTRARRLEGAVQS